MENDKISRITHAPDGCGGQINRNSRLILYFTETKNKIPAFTWTPGTMKQKLHSAAFTLILTFFAMSGSVAVWAQDANFSTDYATPSDGDKVTYSMGGEGEPSPSNAAAKSTSNQKDSIAVKPQKLADPLKTTKKTVAEEDDDSVLSFNFLYFIIRKYKLQDIID